MRLGWLTDIHLNFLGEPQLEAFFRALSEAEVDAWLIGGDIAEGPTVTIQLLAMADRISVPIYFILGNHDFYYSSLAAVASRVHARLSAHPRLVWLTESEPLLLSDAVALVGDDSWADARLGDPAGTKIEVNDFYRIKELKGLGHAERLRALNRLGDAAATRLKPKLESASQARTRVVVLTHVPPFAEAASHEGRRASDEWLPWYTCRAVGDTLLACATAHPECSYLVLCGHTHAAGTCAPLPNLTVLTGGAEYELPVIQQIVEP